ncbi:putative WD repeat-containing protein C2A9.03 [Morella rubra]|uniref:Putative WD repeat-containing protein C2A9.03 n=1 Tax=Morella rubra TaxID=262757 RepID=A0A6A1URC1_9ROSI|nr:putative WD repeat-containing protein C2A9.03 [Morella rubra]
MQLRNLVWATSKHDVYLMSHYSVIHWSSLTCSKSEVLNVEGHLEPSEVGKHPGSLLEGFTQTQVSTLAVKDKLLAAGGFEGELICKHTSLSPDGKLLVIVGDKPEGLMVDSQTGETVMPLCGHLDFSFASAWHPDGVTFATGNQDKTCRVWDVRNLSESVAVLKGNLGAIRSIRYTSDGQYMAMAEPADFVHVYDVKNGYEEEQEIDFFGEISGISFSPDTESLFIGVWDRKYGSLLEYGRCGN